ncbi:MAG: ubiquinol-cytochrome C chaperone family protein [Pseudomonadota bacterium]
MESRTHIYSINQVPIISMLDFLFARLTPSPANRLGERGARAFNAAVAIARKPEFFRRGGVPDTLDGRFALLATVLALLLVRIERDGEDGNPLSVALTERFIAAMESEHRELGLGDPTLGKTVRKLVGALAKRVELWRFATSAKGKWTAAARTSAFAGDPDPAALQFVASELRGLWTRLVAADLAAIDAGDVG